MFDRRRKSIIRHKQCRINNGYFDLQGICGLSRGHDWMILLDLIRPSTT